MSGDSGVSLLKVSVLESITLWKGDDSFLGSSDHEDVLKSGGEGLSSRVDNVGNGVGTWGFLDVLESSDSTNIVTSGQNDLGSLFVLDNSVNVSSLKVKLDGVIPLDVWVWESDSSSVVSDNVWNLVLSEAFSLNSA